jgi:hypothetical protein
MSTNTTRKDAAGDQRMRHEQPVRADQNTPTSLAYREGQPGYSGPKSHAGVIGWGVDLPIENRPAYPKERTPPRLEVPWDKPERQRQNVEVLMSVEHVERPAAFGSVQPPSGVSGMIRRVAFKWAEADIRHWLTLILADRVNVVEGVIDDLAHGHVPNIFAEMGWKGKYKHNKAGFFVKIGIMSAVAGLGIYLLTRNSEDDER